MKRSIRAVVASCATAALVACTPTQQASHDIGPYSELSALAERMIDLEIRIDPLLGYSADVGRLDNQHWGDVSPAALRAAEAEAEVILRDLRGLALSEVSTSDRAIVAGMRERLESGLQMRVCRRELWSVSHMSGWHLSLTSTAREQPVSTAEERADALRRWRTLPAMVDQEIANARAGLDAGYSSPKSVVRRVIRQFDGLFDDTSSANPLYGPAQRSDDAAFVEEFRAVIAGPVFTSLRTYREFLEQEYLPRARDALAVSALPNGAECYRAFLRYFTTSDRSPQEVFELGQRTVAANAARVSELGEVALGTRDIAQIAARTSEQPDNKFASEEELIAFSRDVVGRAYREPELVQYDAKTGGGGGAIRGSPSQRWRQFVL